MKPYLYLFLCLIFFPIISCRKFVEIDPPNNLIVTGNVYSSNETAIAALTNIYAKIQNDLNLPYNLPFYTGLYGDELRNYSTTATVVQMYTNSLRFTDGGFFDNLWQKSYNYIFQANSVIEGCTNSTLISEDVKQRLIAEAKFIRSWMYFNLLNIYGDIPLILTTDYQVNSSLSRTSTVDVYKQIVIDLKAAQLILTSNYVSLNSVSPSSDRLRPNYYTATALLSRVYLFMKDYVNAEIEATTVINNTTLYGLPSIDKVFLKSSNEAIWQIQMPVPIVTTNNTYEGQGFILTAKPNVGFSNSTTISDQLLASFEPGDLRRNTWVGKFTDVSVIPNVVYNFPNKYTAKNSSTISECTIPFRLAEQYLIRSEARARNGSTVLACQDLNKIRNRAGLKDTTTLDASSLINIILHEKQVELFCEYGQRWFDIKRSGNVDEVMNKVSPLKGGTWDSFKKLWPIYNKDVLANPNLSQNPGYNQ